MLLAAASTSSTASQVYPGLAGFLVVAGMGVAVYFLFRSMNKQLKKISPGGPGTPGRPGAPGGPVSSRAGATGRRPETGPEASRNSGAAVSEPDGPAVSGPDAPAGT